MATQAVNFGGSEAANRPLSWSGIFAGTFMFLAIETTFGVLGTAVFASSANPHAANPVGAGISWGAGVWAVVLSIISMYFAGRVASNFSGAITRHTGMRAGLVTFGMCIFTTVLVASIALGSTVGGTTGISNAGPTRVAGLLATGGYWVFVALVLSMISSAVGGMQGVRRDAVDAPAANSGELRRVA